MRGYMCEVFEYPLTAETPTKSATHHGFPHALTLRLNFALTSRNDDIEAVAVFSINMYWRNHGHTRSTFGVVNGSFLLPYPSRIFRIEERAGFRFVKRKYCEALSILSCRNLQDGSLLLPFTARCCSAMPRQCRSTSLSPVGQIGDRQHVSKKLE